MKDTLDGGTFSDDIFEPIGALKLFLEVDALGFETFFEPFDLMEGIPKLCLLPFPRQCVREKVAEELEACGNIL